MSDTKRYGMLEYTWPLIRDMDNQAEYLQQAVTFCQPWLDQEVRLRHCRELAGFYQAAYQVWKGLAGTTTSANRAAKMAAIEVLRRAERGLVLAVKAAQDHGEIGKQGEIGGWPSKEERRGARGVYTIREATGMHQSALQEFRPMAALSDEEFEKALAAAKASGRLSRTNILRIAGGEAQDVNWVPHRQDRTPEAYQRRRELVREMAKAGNDSRQMERVLGTQSGTIRQMAREMGVVIRAEQVTARTKHLRSHKIVTEAIGTLEGVAMSLDLADMWELDKDTIHEQRLALQRAMRRIIARTNDMRAVEERDREHANSTSTT